jgi:holo-[acyl-carrier protein] synthase
MVIGLGIDLLETQRLADALARHGDRFLERVFTAEERAQAGACRESLLALAARFAAKEAALKALGTGWSGGIGFRDVEVRNQPSGAPRLLLHGPAASRAEKLGVRRLMVSLTHQPGVAAAVVILED